MKTIRVLIADDHALVRDGVRQLLELEVDIQVIGEAGDGVEAMKKVRDLLPDVLLLDIAMPKMGGLDTLKQVKASNAATEVVILSMYQKETYVQELLGNGALGYVLKSEPSHALVAAIRAAHRHETYLSPRLRAEGMQWGNANASEAPPTTGYDRLTDREKQVFRLVLEGNSAAEIGKILFISPKTVEKHRANITRKTKLSSPVDMMRYAIRLGVIDPDTWR